MLPLLALLVGLLAAPARQESAQPSRVSVEGLVRTPDGRTYADLEVAESFELGLGEARAHAPFALDALGRFVGSAQVIDGEVSVLACARGGALSGLGVFPVPTFAPGERPVVRGVEIVLRPARRVQALLRLAEPVRIEVGGTALPDPPIELQLLRGDAGALVATTRATAERRLDLFLPEGDFSWWAFGRSIVPQDGRMKVRRGPGNEDLGVIELRLARLAELQGRPAPELALEPVSGAAAPPLGAFAGRWLVIAFVSAADASAFERPLERLVELERELGPSGGLALLAVHGPARPEAAELAARLERLAAERWPGQATPFALHPDREGTSVSRYGIESYPCAVLIAPDGRVAGSGELAEVCAALRRALGAAAQKAR